MRLFPKLAAIALALPFLGGAAAACEIDRPVVFAGLDYDSAQFHTALARTIIEKGYDCATDAIPGSTIPLINGVARGDADVIMEIWTANPAEPWVEAEKAGTVVALGTTFPDAVEGWYVPRSALGEDAPLMGLASVADLPRFKEQFADPEEPGKGRFYNCPSGWQCEVVNTKKLEAYGLDKDFTNFRPGTGEALAAAAEAAAKKGTPALFYYWGPTWLLGKYEFVRLEEKPFDKATWDGMLAADHPTAATAYPTSKVIVGANKAFAEKAPAITAFLKAYSSTNADTSAALAYMRDTGADANAAAVNFLKTKPEAWAAWVPADVAAKVRAAVGG